MQIVAVQLDIAWEDRTANQQRVRELLRSNAPPAGSLIVLPEMFDVGFSMNVAATAQTGARESEAFLRELATTYQSAVVAGVVGPQLHEQASNEALAICPEGRELARYRKQQPFTPSGEHLHYGRGDGHQIGRAHV